MTVYTKEEPYEIIQRKLPKHFLYKVLLHYLRKWSPWIDFYYDKYYITWY